MFCVICAIAATLIVLAQSEAPVKHYNNLIVGGGPSGLYTAWRLSSKSGRPNETTAIFEWSAKRLGGRIFTKSFGSDQHLELGGMRFTENHQILQEVLTRLKLQKNVTDFQMTSDRLYYLRGQHIYESEINVKGVPYRTTDPQHRKVRPEKLFNEIANRVLDKKIPNTTDEWCHFFDNGTLLSSFNSTVFKAGDVVGNIGYWNLLFDQLGSETIQYIADAGGYTSNVMNMNAAQAMYRNSDFSGSSAFKTLDEGFSLLINTLEKEINQSVKISKGQRLTKFHWDANVRKFKCTFLQYDENGDATGKRKVVTSDRLFLCMPKNSIDLIQENDVVADGRNWPYMERKVLKNSKGRYYIESIIEQPAYKIGLLYDHPWWKDAPLRPVLNDSNLVKNNSNQNHGPTVTDLPLRQIYYMGGNRPTGEKSRYYSILASYDDTYYTKFWTVLELTPKQVAPKPEPENLQPLSEGTEVPETMLEMVQQQLNLVHFNTTEMKVPKPIKKYFMNWSLNPFRAGFHAWKAHYKIGKAQYFMTRPGQGVGVPLFVAGSAYSNDQGWIEGAFSTAESILVEEIGLQPITSNYTLICRPQNM